jgi:hypothetical protein
VAEDHAASPPGLARADVVGVADGKDLSTAPKPVRELAAKGQVPQMRRRMLELAEA